MWWWTSGIHVPADFAFKMSTKTEKKRKVGGRGGARAGRAGRAAASAVAPGAAEASLLSADQEPEPESTKDESGEYLLEQKVLRNGGQARWEKLLKWSVLFCFFEARCLCVAVGGLRLAM